MKKTFIILTLFCIGFVASAAYQYNDFVSLENLYSSSNHLVVNQNASLSLDFSSNITKWSSMTIQVTNINGEVFSNNVYINNNTVDIGAYAAGDRLQFFVTNDKGETTLLPTFWGSGWDSKSNTYEHLHFGGNYGKWGSAYTSQQFQVSGSSTPSGQPLPGALAVLLLGGSTVSWLKLRKKSHK